MNIVNFNDVIGKFEEKRVKNLSYYTTIKSLGIFDDEECIKLFDILIECNLIEKILIDAITKKNVKLIDILIGRITEKMANILEMCNDWVSDEDNFINEQCYLLVCKYVKQNHHTLKKICEIAKIFVEENS